MTWELRVRKSAEKSIMRFPEQDQKKIVVCFERLSVNPYSGDIKKIGGAKNLWRRRIGAYRIFYEVFPKEKFIFVFHIERRTSRTY